MRLGSSSVCQQPVSAAGHHDLLLISLLGVWRQSHGGHGGWRDPREARDHGRRHCGLPSRYAAFREGAGGPRMRKDTSWWQQSTSGGSIFHHAGRIKLATIFVYFLASISCVFAEEESTGWPIVLHNEERRSWRQLWKAPTEGLSVPVCSMELPPARQGGWAGPRIHMTLPSFSGTTAECPDLLHYACQLRTNVRAVRPARVQVLFVSPSVPIVASCNTSPFCKDLHVP